MLYQIRHVTRFDYAEPAAFARNNLRLKPILWSGQTIEDYTLIIEPQGRVFPARAEAGLANVVRLVVEQPARTLTIESRARVRVDRAVRELLTSVRRAGADIVLTYWAAELAARL